MNEVRTLRGDGSICREIKCAVRDRTREGRESGSSEGGLWRAGTCREQVGLLWQGQAVYIDWGVALHCVKLGCGG